MNLLLDKQQVTDARLRHATELRWIGIVKRREGKYSEGLAHLARCRAFFERLNIPLESAKYHNAIGRIHFDIGAKSKNRSHLYRALAEYAIAQGYLAEVDDAPAFAKLDNNIADVLRLLSRTFEAHRYLDRAEKVFRAYGEEAELGQLLDVRAQTFEQEGQLSKANEAARESVSILSHGIEQSILVESLITLERTSRKLRLSLQSEAQVKSESRFKQYLKKLFS